MNKKILILCLMLFILQVQVPNSVQATSQSADEVSFNKAEQWVQVCKEDTWSFSGVVCHPEVLCDAH